MRLWDIIFLLGLFFYNPLWCAYYIAGSAVVLVILTVIRDRLF